MIQIVNYILGNYIFDDPLIREEGYSCDIIIEDLPFTIKIKKDDAETNGQWDEQKTFDYLNARYNELLAQAKQKFAREQGLRLDDPNSVVRYNTTTQRLEIGKEVDVRGKTYADDYLVHSPKRAKTPEEARQRLNKEKEEVEKSIGTMALDMADLIEDLIQRVEALEKKL